MHFTSSLNFFCLQTQDLMGGLNSTIVTSTGFRNKVLDRLINELWVYCLHKGSCYTNKGMTNFMNFCPIIKGHGENTLNCPKVIAQKMFSYGCWFCEIKQFPTSRAWLQCSARESRSGKRLDLWWQEKILAEIEEQVDQLLAMVFERNHDWLRHPLHTLQIFLRLQ